MFASQWLHQRVSLVTKLRTWDIYSPETQHTSAGLQVLRGRAQRPYSALVLSGNESSLISECLAKRSWWRSIKTAEGDDITLWNFWWGGNGQCCPYKRFNTGTSRVCHVAVSLESHAGSYSAGHTCYTCKHSELLLARFDLAHH